MTTPLHSYFGKLRLLRIFRLILEIVLIAAAGVCIYLLAKVVEVRILFYHPVIVAAITGSVLLFFLAKSLSRYLSETDSALAKQIDRTHGLKDRFCTAVELESAEHPFREALLHDTERFIPSISTWKILRFRSALQSPGLVCLIAALLLILAIYAPLPAVLQAKSDEAKKVKTEAKKLQSEFKKIDKKSARQQEIKKLLKQFDAETEKLQNGPKTLSEALKEMNRMQEEIEKNQTSLGEKDASKQLQDLKKNSPDDLQKQIDALMQQLQEQERENPGDSKDPDEKIEKALQDALQKGQISRKDFQKLKSAIEELKKDKAEQQKLLAEMQKQLQSGKQSLTGSHQVTQDSKIKDRDIEKSKGGVEDGPGTTNKDIGPHHFDTKKQKESEYVEDKTKAKYEQMYKGERIEAGKDPLLLQNEWDPSGKKRVVRFRGFGKESDSVIAENPTGLSSQSENESSVKKERIPASHQEIVKKYFESVQEQEE